MYVVTINRIVKYCISFYKQKRIQRNNIMKRLKFCAKGIHKYCIMWSNRAAHNLDPGIINFVYYNYY